MRILPIDLNRTPQQGTANPHPAGHDDRLAVGTPLQLRWEEHKGAQRQMRVVLMDVRKSALWVKSERAIAAGTLVNVYTAEFVPIGRASIRECTTRAMDYRIGLYLPGRGTPDL
jgi:hypothetical protein